MQLALMFLAQKKRVAPEELIITDNYVPRFKLRDKIGIFLLLDAPYSLADEAVIMYGFVFHAVSIEHFGFVDKSYCGCIIVKDTSENPHPSNPPTQKEMNES